ncbi:hypothetical protein RJ639_038943 [Escallonia herrerae]|uniref:Uncharacterized protein n=1 Tax=Escallonia herrerae TaxID=1293975 RepID=A0AA88WLU2_9ASTE|nr:hypothetical protein RJ639_038943 [Escallonia herrerae]
MQNQYSCVVMDEFTLDRCSTAAKFHWKQSHKRKPSITGHVNITEKREEKPQETGCQGARACIVESFLLKMFLTDFMGSRKKSALRTHSNISRGPSFDVSEKPMGEKCDFSSHSKERIT